jgi:hypothetical protein
VPGGAKCAWLLRSGLTPVAGQRLLKLQVGKIMFTDRRRLLGLFAASFATPVFAQAPAMTRITAYAFSFAGLEGADI